MDQQRGAERQHDRGDVTADASRASTGTTGGITPRHFHESDGIEDWRVVGEGACA